MNNKYRHIIVCSLAIAAAVAILVYLIPVILVMTTYMYWPFARVEQIDTMGLNIKVVSVPFSSNAKVYFSDTENFGSDYILFSRRRDWISLDFYYDPPHTIITTCDKRIQSCKTSKFSIIRLHFIAKAEDEYEYSTDGLLNLKRKNGQMFYSNCQSEKQLIRISLYDCETGFAVYGHNGELIVDSKGI